MSGGTGVTAGDRVSGGGDAHAGWRWALVVVGVVTLVRLVWVLMEPVGLAADEAQYWDWSRRLDLSYYSKGPGVAWTIAASAWLFGVSEASVRIGAVVSGAGVAVVAGLVAACAYPATKNVALYAVGAVLAAPILSALSVLMTIDGPYVMWWGIATLCALGMLRSDAGRARAHVVVSLGIVFGVALGVAFLYKYTAALLALSIGVWLIVDRWRPRLSGWAWLGFGLGGVAFCVVASPIAVWNAEHGWPTVRHLLGHLNLPGGDVPAAEVAGKDALDAGGGGLLGALGRVGEYVGAQLGLAGPVLVLAAGLTVERVLSWWRGGGTREREEAWGEGASTRFLLCVGWVIFAVYLFVAVLTQIEGNWPVAGLFGLSVFVAGSAARRVPGVRARVRAWRAGTRRVRSGIVSKKPETWTQIGWDWSVAYGVLGLAAIVLVVPASRLPVVGGLIPVHRLDAGRELARVVQPVVDAETAARGEEPVVLTHRYTNAAWLAFYLDGRPRVSSAASERGDRASAYDYFDDTRLDSPVMVGRPAVLVGGSVGGWENSALVLDGVSVVVEGPIGVYVTERYGGVRRGGGEEEGAGDDGG